MSLLGSRVVLARAGSNTASAVAPSVGAQALAVLLEDASRIARTTLNRLVQSGHATRPAAGKFRAKAR